MGLELSLMSPFFSLLQLCFCDFHPTRSLILCLEKEKEPLEDVRLVIETVEFKQE
jgi:hypothetical protein